MRYVTYEEARRWFYSPEGTYALPKGLMLVYPLHPEAHGPPTVEPVWSVINEPDCGERVWVGTDSWKLSRFIEATEYKLMRALVPLEDPFEQVLWAEQAREFMHG